MTRSTTKDFAPSTPNLCSPEIQNRETLEQRLWTMCIERGTGDWQDYERAKRFIDGLNVNAHNRDRLIRWIIEYLEV